MSRQRSRARSRDDEAGFGVLEVLVATAIIVLIAFTGLAACTAVASVLRTSSTARQSASGVDEVASHLRDDAASAFAIWLPATTAGAGREVDFYARTAGGADVFWRYVYDPAVQTLQRWDFDGSGAAGVRDATGRIDPAAAYPPLRDVTSFAATAIPADRLGDASRNVYAGLSGIFARTPGAQAVPYAVPGTSAAPVGGNGVVQISIGGPSATRIVHLLAGSLPAGFTVTGALDWHAVIYRVDQTHRFGGGLAGKSHVFINARVDVTYDGWATRHTWCDFNLLGNPDGLDPHDPHANYAPGEPVEQAATILAACRLRHPIPPARDGGEYAPDADTPRPGASAR